MWQTESLSSHLPSFATFCRPWPDTRMHMFWKHLEALWFKMCKILSCISPTVNPDQSCRLPWNKHKHVNTVTTCMLSAFCHCSASLSIPVAFWRAHVSLCQNKRIFQPSHQPQEPEPRVEQRNLHHRRWAVAAEAGSQTASHSLPPSQRDSDVTQTNIWARWARGVGNPDTISWDVAAWCTCPFMEQQSLTVNCPWSYSDESVRVVFKFTTWGW